VENVPFPGFDDRNLANLGAVGLASFSRHLAVYCGMSTSQPRFAHAGLDACTIFISAFLLFQLQPLITKIILPWFRGSAAVWTTCMLFFQATLLLGYLYAHWTTERLRPRVQAGLHLALVAAMAMRKWPAAPEAVGEATAPPPGDPGQSCPVQADPRTT
jgi:hypothetical protein